MGFNSQNARIYIQLKLQDARRVMAEAAAVSASIRAIGSQAVDTEGRLRGASLGIAGMGSALSVVRRSIQLTGMSLAFMGTAALGVGLQFNSTMQSNQLAMSQFTGSIGTANDLLDYMYDLAAKTPFEFQDLATATRRMLGFGMTVERTKTLMVTLGDAIAGIGGGQDQVRRAVIAIGQIQAKNRVFAEELLQLTEIGIPAYKIIQEELGLTAESLNRVGDLGIDANTAIAALMRGMDKRFKGAAALQATTFAGQLSTFKDYARQALGEFTMPLFTFLTTDVFPEATKVAKELTSAFQIGGMDLVITWLDLLYGETVPVQAIWDAMGRTAQALSTILTGAIIPALQTLSGSGGALKLILMGLIGTLELMADHTTILKWALITLITAYVAWKVALITTVTWLKISHTWYMITTTDAVKLTAAQVVLKGAYRATAFAGVKIYTLALKVGMGVQRAYMAVMLLMRMSLHMMILQFTGATMSARIFNTALMSLPVFWIVAALVAIGVAIYLLITHWDQVKAAAGAAADFIKDHWQDFFEWWLLWPYKLAKMTGFWDFLKKSFVSILNWLIDKWNWFAEKLHVSIDIPGAGTFSTPDLTIGHVGVNGGGGAASSVLPGGGGENNFSRPMPAALPNAFGTGFVAEASTPDFASGMAAAAGPKQIVVPLMIDRRQVAEAVWEEGRTTQARR